jgi:hypothetical protein
MRVHWLTTTDLLIVGHDYVCVVVGGGESAGLGIKCQLGYHAMWRRSSRLGYQEEGFVVDQRKGKERGSHGGVFVVARARATEAVMAVQA